MSVALAILAAGRARRFGGGKLDAYCAGKPLGRWVLDAIAAAGLPPGQLIVGPDAPGFARDAMADGWTLITNPLPEDGLGGSVALAAKHAECTRANALLLLLADMPLIGAARIGALLAHQPLTQPVATRYFNGRTDSGRSGVPARFPASMLGDLAGLSGDRGAATLLYGRTDVHVIDAAAEELTDVDNAEGLIRAERLLLTPGHRR